jgi:protein TonB
VLNRFFALSLGLHALTLLVFYPGRSVMTSPSPQEAIPVTILPAPEKRETEPTRVPKAAPTRPTRAPTIVARKDSPPVPSGRSAPARPPTGKNDNSREEAPTPMPVAPAPAPREPVAERTVITERPLPSLKELLPPPTWSSGSRDSGPVSLNTRDPIYVSYFNKIKQSIELQWEYPEVALRYGLQGRLSLEFAIAANGQLERLRILRSSGSQVLDDEALRAIKAAAPFPPIPPWIKANPLSISAFMEYHDNRLNYQFNR